jgi:hypothetical protein
MLIIKMLRKFLNDKYPPFVYKINAEEISVSGPRLGPETPGILLVTAQVPKNEWIVEKIHNYASNFFQDGPLP